MKKLQAKNRIYNLRELLKKYAYEYYVDDAPSVSDAIYDGLIRELKSLEQQFPDLITPDSPTQRISAVALDSYRKVTHASRMLSLNDVFSREDVEAWIIRMKKLSPSSRLEFFVDIKMDGLAASIIYKDGQYTQAVTRGDGYVGEDVTMNIKTIANVPLSLRRSKDYENLLSGTTEIRGEVIMLKHDFAALNHEQEASGKPIYANPRNLAAGTIRQLDPKLVANRKLHFRAYDIIRDDTKEVPTNIYAYQALSQLGITRNNQATVYSGLDQVMGFVDKWEQERHRLPFNTDGLVIKLNDRKLFESLGIVGKSPRGAVAYKYPAEKSTSIIKDIVISIGRTGAATPVAVFEPIVIAGTTIQHASLHNPDEISRKDIRIGDTAVIYKAGDIIPQVDQILFELRPKTSKAFDMEAELKRQYPELKFKRRPGEAVYRVIGATGPLLLKKAIEHFASKPALNVEGLGEKNASALVDSGLVNDISDIFIISKNDVENIERFAELSSSNLIKAIQKSKSPTLPRFIYGLGIRHVGTQTAIELSEWFGSLEKLKNASIDELMSIEGIGDIVAESIFAWFADPENGKLLEKFENLGVKPIFESTDKGSLHGKNFVVTGTIESISREEVASKIRALGGKFQSSITSNTDYLVVGKEPGKSKVSKALAAGINQINANELKRMLDN